MRLSRSVFRLALFALAAAVFAPGPPAAAGCLDVSRFLEAPAAETAADARVRAWRAEVVEEEFPYTRAQALDKLAEAYPDARRERLERFLDADPDDGGAACVRIRGEKRYFQGVDKNMGFRNTDLLREALVRQDAGSPFFDQARHLVLPRPKDGYPLRAWKPYAEPMDWLYEMRLDLERAKLPAEGELTVWLPLPVLTPAQRDVRLVDVRPAEALVLPPRLDGGIGSACLRFDLAELEGDLEVVARALFTSHVQRFRVDPAAIPEADPDDDAHRAYLAPGHDIALTPGLRAEALAVAAGETNPWTLARRFYDHILAAVPYSLTPHATLMLLGIPESEWVRTMRRGDCGAQSMFFAAMCRAVGIPARATGGHQLFPGMAGPHFWAEFFLPGHGWIPVDPTVAEASDWTGSITEEQRAAFKDFYFGNLDPYRLVIQTDVDKRLSPDTGAGSPYGNLLTGPRPLLVLQSPWVDCPTCKETNPLDLLEGASWSAVPVDR